MTLTALDEFDYHSTYSVQGTLGVPSGATNYLPPFFFPVPRDQFVVLREIRVMVRSGTITFSVQQNGANITGLTSLAGSTTPATYTPSGITVVGDGDYFAPVLSAVSSADGLSLSFFFTVSR